MLGSIYTGLSGMNAYSQGLQTISNNVSNLNSLGYKATSVNFSDVFNNGGGGLTYSREAELKDAGNGVRFGAPRVDFSQGEMRQTDGELDLAIQGHGFLILTDNDKTYYGRTGRFEVDKDGYISDQVSKYHLAIIGKTGQPEALNIDKLRTSKPVATTKISFSDNLSSTGTDAIVSDIAVYDSAGGKQIWRMSFHAEGAAAPGQWNITITDQTGRTVATSTLKFIGGIVDPTTETLTVTDEPDGAAPLSVVLDFSNGVTSFSSGTTSTIRAAITDGNGVGALTGVSIDKDGQIKLTYSNAQTELVGTVAIADFNSPQDLTRIGNGLFENKNGSGRRVLASGVDGVGKLISKQLEASNVDLSREFGDLILIQRGFQASSQVVSVSNDMIQELFGIRGHG